MPAWPIAALLGGLIVWWASGGIAFVATIASACMLWLMVRRGARWLPGLGPWVALCVWVLACGFSLTQTGSVMGYGLRALDILNAGVAAVYVASARERLTRDRIIVILCFTWATVVVLGYAAMAAPDFRLSTPIGKLLPGAITSNELIQDLVNPRLAEVQLPWGAQEAFKRPAAPFPYANSWGLAYALLTPVVLARLTQVRGLGRKLAWAAVLLASLGPALATSNRGMLGALGVSLLVAAVQLALAGRWIMVGSIVGGGVLVASVAVLSGAIDSITERLTHSSSTGDRFELYERTLDRALQRPWLGHASPQLDPVVGVSFGTQGMVWLLIFCFGFPALLFFGLFLAEVLVRGWRVPDTAGAWLYSAFPALIIQLPFYSLNNITMVLVVVMGVTVIASARPRPPRPRVTSVPSWAPGRSLLPAAGREALTHARRRVLAARARLTRSRRPASFAQAVAAQPGLRTLVPAQRLGELVGAGVQGGQSLSALAPQGGTVAAPAALVGAEGRGGAAVTLAPERDDAADAPLDDPAVQSADTHADTDNTTAGAVALTAPGITAGRVEAVEADRAAKATQDSGTQDLGTQDSDARGTGAQDAVDQPRRAPERPVSLRRAALSKRKRSTAKLAGSTFGLVILGAVLAFAATLLVGNVAGDAAAGVFFQVIAFFNIAVVGSVLGADTALVRELAARVATGRAADTTKVLKIALVPVLAVSTLLALAAWLGAPAVARGDEQLVAAIRWAAPFVPLGALMTALFGALRGLGRVRTFSVLQNVVLPASRLLLVGVVLFLGVALVPLTMAWTTPVALVLLLAAALVAFAARTAAHRRFVEALNAEPLPAPSAKRFWSFASARGAAALVETCLEWIDVICVGVFLGPAAAGAYGAVNRCVRMGSMLDQTARLVTGPMVSAAMARGEKAAATAVYEAATKVLVASAWPFYLILAVFAPVFLGLFGEGFAVAAPAMTLISLVMMLAVSAGGVQSVLLMAGKSSWQLRNKICALAVAVGGCLWLIPQYGLLGAAAAWGGSVLVDAGLATAQVWFKLGFVPPLRSVAFAGGTALACFGALGLGARTLLGATWPALLATLFAGGILYLVAVLFRPALFGVEGPVASLLAKLGRG